MTRHAYVRPRLDALHERLAAQPKPVTVDQAATLLPKVRCHCIDQRRSHTPDPKCWRCRGDGEGYPDRIVAYQLLVKLEADGRAQRDRSQVTHLWSAVPAEPDDMDDHWDWLGAQAPVSAELALEEAVREHGRLAQLLADKDRTRATTQRELDELICGLCEGRTLTAVAELLGIRLYDVRAARDRLFRHPKV